MHSRAKAMASKCGSQSNLGRTYRSVERSSFLSTSPRHSGSTIGTDKKPPRGISRPKADIKENTPVKHALGECFKKERLSAQRTHRIDLSAHMALAKDEVQGDLAELTVVPSLQTDRQERSMKGLRK